MCAKTSLLDLITNICINHPQYRPRRSIHQATPPCHPNNGSDTEPVASVGAADIDTNMILQMISLLEDNRISKKTHSNPVPSGSVDTLHQEITNLTAQLSDKNDKIVHLESREETLLNWTRCSSTRDGQISASRR